MNAHLLEKVSILTIKGYRMKQKCCRCKQVKIKLGNFKETWPRSGTFKRICNTCKRKEWDHNSYENRLNKNWAKVRWSAKKAVCKTKGIKFDLPLSFFEELPSKCPVFGWALEPKVNRIKARTPTIDRINPKGDYILNNCVWMSWRANKLKSDATLQEVEALYNYLKKE